MEEMEVVMEEEMKEWESDDGGGVGEDAWLELRMWVDGNGDGEGWSRIVDVEI